MASLSESPEPWLNTDNDSGADMDVVLEEGEDEDSTVYQKEEANLFLATRENKVVWIFRFLVTFILICVAVAICVTVFLTGKKSEREDFEVVSVALGQKMVSDFESALKRRVSTIESFAMDLTATVMRDPTVEWPFFTPSEYERRAARTAELADLASLFLLPKVSTEQKLQWEEYSRKNQGWIREGIAVRQGVSIEEVQNVNPITPVIVHMGPEGRPQKDEGPGPYFPIWMQYPAFNTTFTNLNPYGTIRTGRVFISALLETMRPTFPISQDFWDDPNRESHVTYQRIKRQYPDYPGDPYYTSYYPVFDNLGKDRQLVALIIGATVWRRYFENMLPDGSNEMIVVLENKCGQVYSYSVRGTSVQFMGYGDQHDPRYDYLEVGSNLSDIFDVSSNDQTRETMATNTSNTTRNVNIGNCQYRIRVYPSKEFEDGFYSNEPTLYALSLAFVFFITCSVFLSYDYTVERRQKVVLKSAMQSGKLVSSLFPEDVRKRLYEEEEEEEDEKKTALKIGWKSTANLVTAASLRDVEQGNSTSEHSSSDPSSSRHAIATLYPETTIFFADLAGFTKWSSSRTPVEVFDLLEKVYGEFDKLAKKFHVFKVETIGDCYVAVTGLPDAQPNHAILICKFARSCMSKFHLVTASLADTLGQDTAELDLRVGLHTGPVTAGVLRGEKSRFQLFGDTVNTTSRMESNGLPGRIHCSQDTADALKKSGKGHWLKQREETIVAKGKGEMTTYWVEVKGSVRTAAGSRSVGSHLADDSSRWDDTTTGSYSCDNLAQKVLLDDTTSETMSMSLRGDDLTPGNASIIKQSSQRDGKDDQR